MKQTSLEPHHTTHSAIGRTRTSVPGALVIGGDYQGLGIARSLGRRGIPVCVLDDERSISRYSRYVKHFIKTPSLREESDIVEATLAAGKQYGLEGSVLFPTREEVVAAFSHNRSRLAETFRVPTPDWRTIEWAWDKRKTYELASELGIPTPATWYVRREEELESLDLRFPVAIKPAIKEHFIYATKAKAWRANSLQELGVLFRKASRHVGCDEVMIQDLIPGDGKSQYAYCAFFKDKRSVGKLLARRLRQHPPEFGRATTFAETTTLPEIEVLSERFLDRINYYGLVEMEYKQDPRDGSFKLLDVNARTWGYHTIGAAADVDFSFMLYADQIGEPVEAAEARPGVRWVRLLTDLPTVAGELARGRLNVREYLRTIIKTNTEAVFCWDDPVPGAMEFSLIPYLYLTRGF